MKLTWDQVLRWRIDRQYLGATKPADPVAVARRLSGVHAQVAASAVSAVDLRTKAAVTAKKIDALLYDKRKLVRTWAARGTLHLLPADDLPTWVAAMSTRTRETTGSWLKYHGVTAAQMSDIHAALPDVLGSDPLTREELADALIGATGHDDLRQPLTQWPRPGNWIPSAPPGTRRRCPGRRAGSPPRSSWTGGSAECGSRRTGWGVKLRLSPVSGEPDPYLRGPREPG
jgi:hypothetical protein